MILILIFGRRPKIEIARGMHARRCAGLEIFGFQVPMTILNSHFSNLNSGKSIRKLLEIQISLGSEYLVQY